ncbi:MAG: histidinol-phosphate transaminase [Bacteroidota bacterium]
MTNTNISPFKDYLLQKVAGYKGGKSRADAAQDRPIYKLSSNENMLGASPKAMAAVQANLHQLNEYPDNSDGRLRQALSDFYPGLMPDQFITDNSGVGVIQLIVNSFLGEGLECIFSNPCFIPYHSFPPKIGAKVVEVPLIGDQFELNVAGILNAINDRTRLIWLCSPNNPTGTHLAKAQLDQLLDQVPDHVIIIYDEVYYQFATAPDFTTALPYVKAGKQIIGVNSFSKAYGLAGLRIGYAYASEKIARYVSNMRRPFLINTLSMEAAIAALQDDEFIQRTVATINEGKAYLYPELDQLGIQYWKSQANFILMKPPMGELEFEDLMLAQGIMIRPATSFGAPGCVRVTIGTMEANQALIQGLKEVLSK